MRIETTVSVAAPRESVWTVMTDVESWPEISESVTSLRKLAATGVKRRAEAAS